jgi:Family of unknown function (DUF6460)
MSDNALSRFLGGSLTSVLIKLLILSVVVGALLHWTGLSPVSLLRGLDALVRELVGTGWDAVRNVGAYALYGAMVVVPIWLISRLISQRKGGR